MKHEAKNLRTEWSHRWGTMFLVVNPCAPQKPPFEVDIQRHGPKIVTARGWPGGTLISCTITTPTGKEVYGHAVWHENDGIEYHFNVGARMAFERAMKQLRAHKTTRQALWAGFFHAIGVE